MITGGITMASMIMTTAAFAQTEPATKADLGATNIALNLLWVVLGGSLVVFMQAGFALVETGFCQARHAAHVVSTNFAIFGLGIVGFFFVGFPLAFGSFSYASFGLDKPVGGALIGSGNWILLHKGPLMMMGKGYAPAALAFFFYMGAIMDTPPPSPQGLWRSAGSGTVLWCGAFLWGHLLPNLRGLDMGRRLAQPVG